MCVCVREREGESVHVLCLHWCMCPNVCRANVCPVGSVFTTLYINLICVTARECMFAFTGRLNVSWLLTLLLSFDENA